MGRTLCLSLSLYTLFSMAHHRGGGGTRAFTVAVDQENPSRAAATARGPARLLPHKTPAPSSRSGLADVKRVSHHNAAPDAQKGASGKPQQQQQQGAPAVVLSLTTRSLSLSFLLNSGLFVSQTQPNLQPGLSLDSCCRTKPTRPPKARETERKTFKPTLKAPRATTPPCLRNHHHPHSPAPRLLFFLSKRPPPAPCCRRNVSRRPVQTCCSSNNALQTPHQVQMRPSWRPSGRRPSCSKPQRKTPSIEICLWSTWPQTRPKVRRTDG